jgi:hypothetical protein
MKDFLKGTPIVVQVLATAFLFISFKYLKENISGYIWVSDVLIKKNVELMEKHKNLSFLDRQNAKLGASGRFANFIKFNTPENAIILMPPDSIIMPPNIKSDFNKHLKNKTWVSYIVYPRKLVYEDKNETTELYNSATHVAIVNGWGYHKLNYAVNEQPKHYVFPINN